MISSATWPYSLACVAPASVAPSPTAVKNSSRLAESTSHTGIGELSHGRLAMLAAAGFMAQEAATGTTWGAQDIKFENFLLGGYFSQEAAELAQDAIAKDLVPNLIN